MIVPVCSFIKWKEDGTQRLYRYTIYERHREMGLGVLERSLKRKPVNLVTQ
ncbi:hypothetical protein [Bartonella harrusi]|uniref:Uncharacterized protein n=1 Tax=Bartonella harrusi TaxID=2961895 RepID=A0ABY5ETZ3_9HYPH|nr:hypothetical protein [Bartonella harrusi]UTO28614.1 hypothetical protein NMK50_00825 [Bartonella harrusi]